MKKKTTTQIVEELVPIERRLHRSKYFKKEYPESVPIFVHYESVDDSIHRYLVPRDNNSGHLLVVFRRKLSIKSSVGIFLLIEQKREGKEKIDSFQVSSSTSIGELADKYLHDDGFLYINITTENVFG